MGAVAYASPEDSAQSFPGAPHVHSGADECVTVRDGAAMCRKRLLVSDFYGNIYRSAADHLKMAFILTTQRVLERVNFRRHSRHHSTVFSRPQPNTGSSAWPAT
jgi:hypothetical protein